jgi:hypothetical protein
VEMLGLMVNVDVSVMPLWSENHNTTITNRSKRFEEWSINPAEACDQNGERSNENKGNTIKHEGTRMQ